MSISLGAVSVDCADPQALAAFWSDLLDAVPLFDTPGAVGIQIGGTILVMQRVEPYEPPTWPGHAVLHLDLGVEGQLQDAVDRALTLGAVETPEQYDDRWRVLLDPAGHPFCLTTVTALPS